MRNEPRLKANPRMAMPYRTLAKMDAERRGEIAKQAKAFLGSL
jgi:deoxyribodipyrimidine photolyase-related protein